MLRAGRLSAGFGVDDSWLGWGLIGTVRRVLSSQPAAAEGIGWQAIDRTSLARLSRLRGQHQLSAPPA